MFKSCQPGLMVIAWNTFRRQVQKQKSLIALFIYRNALFFIILKI